MSLLNSAFDIVSVDNPVAVAALAVVLPVDSSILPSPVFSVNGTPNTAGTIPPGTIVTMNSSGNAVLATTAADVTTAATRATNLKPIFVVLDGNQDYSGAFVQKLTCLQGGFTMLTDQFNGVISTFTPGTWVTFSAGKISVIATQTNQILGVVGPAGFDSVANTVQVIIPQGWQ